MPMTWLCLLVLILMPMTMTCACNVCLSACLPVCLSVPQNVRFCRLQLLLLVCTNLQPHPATKCHARRLPRLVASKRSHSMSNTPPCAIPAGSD
jgi:hypothetical protein